jgi:cytochrome c
MNKHMHCNSLLVATVLLGVLASTAQAAEPDAAALADAMKCQSCHALEEALIGPPWKAIAARHAGADRTLATEVLSRKIIKGGGGNWGVVPMVPNEHVSAEDARRLASWILGMVQQ